MSTWCSTAETAHLGSGAGTGFKDGAVESFVYPAVAGNDDTSTAVDGRASLHDALLAGLTTADRRLLEERIRSSEKSGWERGMREGEQAARDQYERFLGQQRAAVGAAVKQFVEERQNYFRQVEGEVVQLALAIARKILHREAQLDPMMLAGLVRYSLAQLDTATSVKLRVHPDQETNWRQVAAQMQRQIEVVGDAGLASFDCVLETEVGSMQISLEGQLKEIERGFFDLLRQRPQL